MLVKSGDGRNKLETYNADMSINQVVGARENVMLESAVVVPSF